MERPWLEFYPPEVPKEISLESYTSLVDLIEESFKVHANKTAYSGMGKELTFSDVDEMSTAFGAWLQSTGLAKGARVAIMLPNVLQYPVALSGALRAGYVVVNVNPLYTPRELEHQLKDSGAEAIIVLENFATTVESVLAKTNIKHVVVASMGDLLGGLKGTLVNFVVRKVKKMVPAYHLPSAISFKSVLAKGRGLKLSKPSIGLGDLAFLQYTGGTTGVAKGAMLTQRNILANILQSEAWSLPAINNTKRGPAPENSVIVAALPLYHIFALTVCGFLGMRQGNMLLLIANPRDLDSFVKDLSVYQDKITVFPAVNTLYNALLNHAGFRELKFPNLRLSMAGGMAAQQVVAENWLKVTGCPICEGYGLSETSPSIISNLTNTEEFTGTIGIPIPSSEAKILDDDGNEVPYGTPGEIAVRGPQVMAGYWQRPDETAKVMTPDGFFKTGDIGFMNEKGFIKIVDRKKDMILVSGFNVFPNEIEEVVMEQPGVMECAAVGIPDPHSGEAVKLFVVKKDPNLTVEQLMDFCRERLTGYKRPKVIEFKDELPKSNVGKILRRELRDNAN